MTRAGAFLAVVTFGGVALASPTKSECVDANERGQVMRKQERLHDARTVFRTCSDVACPSVVRRDCEGRLEDVERAMATIVLEATDAKGKLERVTVTVDGAPFANRLDGAPVEIDPGPHHFVFHVEGYPNVTRDVGIDEGDRGRRVSVSFAQAVLAASPPAGGSLRTGGLVLASVGLAGIVLGSILGVGSFVSWASVNRECPTAPSCDYARATADRDQAIGFATASDVSFVVGGVLAAAGIALFVLGTRVTPAVGPRLIGLSLTETF